MKSHEPIICESNSALRFIVTTSRERMCDYCHCQIKENSAVLTIGYRCWIHVGCIEPMNKLIEDFKKNNLKELLVNNL